MADSIKDTLKETGQTVAEAAGRAADWVKDKVGLSHTPLGAADMTAIRPHMDVISSCGCRVGTVDHMEGGAIKLTRTDSPDGRHHFIPTGWVARVDDHVHLNKDAGETRQGWKTDAASCAGCGA